MKRVIPLKEGWAFGGFDPDAFSVEELLTGRLETVWRDTSVPGDVHTELMRYGVILDPAVGTNDVQTLWVERQVWVYQTRFSLGREELSASALELLFEGLDTYADVYVNGSLCGHCENMLVEHRLDAKPFVSEGENRLDIVFWPFGRCSTRKALPEGFWINYSTERAYARKAAYQVGWDWTPRVCTVGVWRPASVQAVWNGVLDGLQAQTVCIEPEENRAVLHVCAQYRLFGTGEARVRFTLEDDWGHACACCESESGDGSMTVERPRLWWTHDQGQPYCYMLRAELLDAQGRVLDCRQRRVGIRTVHVEERDPETGEARFVMVLNGRRIFARGANWVPASNRPASVDKAQYLTLLRRAKQANMNALCIWGGGIYEQDVFYDFCDREGILIWQYFMFACGEYPGFDPEFVENVRDEVTKAVRRLTGHPSIALWIGNVESRMLCEKIGLQRPMYGQELFEKQIPEWLRQLDPNAVYLPGSPWGEGLANSMASGDRHNWDVWFNDIPYTDYCKDLTCFASEFGVHGAPSREVFEKTTGLRAPTLESFEVQYLNRDQDLSRMRYYLREYTGEPVTLNRYIADTMLIQALALACACSHYRHRFPDCGGALIWQLNDCCGAHSWSIVDSCNIPKAAWYFVRQAFAPVAVYLEECPANETRVWVMNHGSEVRETRLNLEIGDFFGTRVLSETIELTLAPGESRCVRTLRAGGRFYPNAILMNRPRLYYLAAALEGEARPYVRYFERPKDLLLPVQTLEEEWGDGWVRVQTRHFAQFVHLEGLLEGFEIEDNYFDLLPGTERILRFEDPSGQEPQARGLHWTSRNPKEENI